MTYKEELLLTAFFYVITRDETGLLPFPRLLLLALEVLLLLLLHSRKDSHGVIIMIIVFLALV